MFVNFNAARYALEPGVFEVERAVPFLARTDAKKPAVVKDDENEASEVNASANEKCGSASVFGAVTGANIPGGCNRGDNVSSASTPSLVPASISSDAVDVAFIPATTKLQKEITPVDPSEGSAPPSLRFQVVQNLCLGFDR